MTISLNSETQKLVEAMLKSGQYHTADEIVQVALEAFNQAQKYALDEKTLDAIDRAEDQIERGEIHDWSQVRERVRANFLGK